MLCTNGHNNYDYVTKCQLCGVSTFIAPTNFVKPLPDYCGFAIVSMILGIVWIDGLGAVLALIFGYMAKREIARTGKRGEAMATAGIVLGWVGIAGAIILFTIFGVFIAKFHFPTCHNNVCSN
ncbi:MAG: DUF4190 domain-containing protein [Acidimicrobiales bacterium]